jgi:trehalose/maltose hydrolase-like predicted phosphorylase
MRKSVARRLMRNRCHKLFAALESLKKKGNKGAAMPPPEPLPQLW